MQFQSVLDQIRNLGYDFAVGYIGRFQPFNDVHLQAYTWLVDNFGADYVYPFVSTKFKFPKEPFTIEERTSMIETIIPPTKGKIVGLANMFLPSEAFLKLNKPPHKTVPILAVGEVHCHKYPDTRQILLKPDMQLVERDLPTIGKNKMFMVVIPEMRHTLPLGDEVVNLSSSIRDLFTKGFKSTEEGKTFFKALYGFYNDDIYNLMHDRLAPQARVDNGDMINFRDTNDPKYKAWRFAVMSKCSFRCVWCGKGSSDGAKIEAHHIVRWADDPRKRYLVDNGCVLCKEHHDMVYGQEEKYAQTLRVKLKEHLALYGDKITRYEINKANRGANYRPLNPRVI